VRPRFLNLSWWSLSTASKEYAAASISSAPVGYRQRFGRAYYTYFDWPVGGVIYQFWTMGVPIAREYVINRAIKKAGGSCAHPSG
jgi:hypothetical protein